MRRFTALVLVLASALAVSSAWAEKKTGNCKGMAKQLSPSPSVLNFSLEREWDEAAGHYEVDKDGKLIWVTTGGWKDQAPDSERARHLGGYWFKIGLTKGKDYVVAVKDVAGMFVSFRPVERTTHTEFSMVKAEGVTYNYIRAAAWDAFDADAVEFYVYAYGGSGSVGTASTISFQQAEVEDVLPAIPGTIQCPIQLDVSASGSTEIAAPPTTYLSRKATIYSAALKAGEDYLFFGVAPTANLKVFCVVTDYAALRKVGTYEMDETTGNLKVRVTVDYELTLAIVPDNEHWQTGNVGGGLLMWTIGEEPEPEVVSAGTFRATLIDEETESERVDFVLTAKCMNNGETAWMMTATVDGHDIEFTDVGGGMLSAKSVIGDKTWTSRFAVELAGSKAAEISGSLYLDRGGAKEFFFGGEAGGSLVEWAHSFLRFDPEFDSAAAMGITTGAFAGLPANDGELKRLHAWGVSENAPTDAAALIEFSATGDPEGLPAEAYLLGCEVDSQAVEEAADELRIVGLDPLTFEVEVSGGLHDKDEWHNGYLEVRSSPTPDGEFVAGDESKGGRRFFRVYLVHEVSER